MDPILELARHPDIVEAIERIPPTDGAAGNARELLQMRTLAVEYPNAWVTEVVRAFYETPALASSAWIQLGKCRRAEAERAKRSLRDGRSTSWPSRKKHAQPPPATPTFIQDILATKSLSAEQYAQEVATLLKHPERLRDCVPEWMPSPDASAERTVKVPVPFAFVHESELHQIGKTRRARGEEARDPCDKPEEPATFRWHPARRAFDMHLCGLALSGGGIRSATFNLGVLQTLAQNGLLKRFDYLSTVSGGGYIGSWLAAWIRRETDEQVGQHSNDTPMAAIERRLSPTRSPNPIDDSVRPIRFLREYSNYLTPRTGFLSADTWTMVGIYVRNALLNQVTMVGLLVAVLLLPRGLHAVCSWSEEHVLSRILAVLCWVCGIGFLAANLRRLDPPEAPSLMEDEEVPSFTTARSPRWFAKPRVIQLLVAVPWMVAAALTVQWLNNQSAWQAGLIVGTLVGVSLLFVLIVGRADRCWERQGNPDLAIFRAISAMAGSAAVAGLVAAGLTWAVFRVVAAIPIEADALTWHLAALATPGLISAISLAIVAMLGILGAPFPDEHREWWSRFRTMLHIDALAWLVWFAAAVYIPWGLHAALAAGFGAKSAVLALAGWLGTTIFGIRRGQIADAMLKEDRESSAPRALSRTVLHYSALAAPYVFAVGLVLTVSVAIHEVIAHNVPECAALRETPERWRHAYWTCADTKDERAFLWAAFAFGVALLFSWRVNINEFSIHHFYKNRLVRCYLGASRGLERKPDWFTGFDPNDDVPLRSFDVKEKRYPPYPGPYPIVNCALNLVSGRDLAWQERKATSFVFTPKYCGYDVDRAILDKNARLRSEGFVPTREFYGDGGPSIGTAMAISGAAANPNMGRSSSPALTFLMTVFNVRLGWWIGNPRRKTSPLPGPRLGLLYTLQELFGATDDSRRFVNLSDGGHFDNLGVYELVRRCCRYIVVCDASQDGRFVFENLGDLIRRCRTDFGVEIEIAVDRIRQRDQFGRSQTHCVVGQIHYLNMPRRDKNGELVDKHDQPLKRDRRTNELLPGQMPGHEIGYLVYIKPTMTGDEPQDVLEYFRRIPEFPHQTTANQWFGESQFESYRKLGMHIAHSTFARYLHEGADEFDLKSLFVQLHQFWFPPSQAINERVIEHATEYSRIMETLRKTPSLQGLDSVVFSKFREFEDRQVPSRDEFYVCNQLIQLMENVYADLDLESNWEHPHVKGWRAVFENWAQQPAFRQTWNISENTYAARFRNFYNEMLKGNRAVCASADEGQATIGGVHGEMKASAVRSVAEKED